MKVEFKSREAELLPAEKMSFDPTQIPKAVRDTGFKPGPVQITVGGVLSRDGDLLILEMSGPVKKMILAGGDKFGEISEKPSVLDQRVRVVGKLHPSHADKPPGITVESWELIASPSKKQGSVPTE